MIDYRIQLSLLAALTAAVLTGCSREEQPEPAPAAETGGGNMVERMSDPVYRAQLKAHADKRDSLMAQYAKLTGRMRELLAAKQAELGTDDEAALKAAMEADPEWSSLYQRCIDLDVAIGDEQRRARETVRQRISK